MKRYARLSAAYEMLDAAAVNAALAKYLRVEKMVEIMAGTFAEEPVARASAGAR